LTGPAGEKGDTGPAGVAGPVQVSAYNANGFSQGTAGAEARCPSDRYLVDHLAEANNFSTGARVGLAQIAPVDLTRDGVLDALRVSSETIGATSIVNLNITAWCAVIPGS